MAKIKKAQRGAGVPKGYVRGEMTGRLIPEKKFKANEVAFAKELQKQKDYRDSVDRASKTPAKKYETSPFYKAAVEKKKREESYKNFQKEYQKPAPKKKLKAGGKLSTAKAGKEMIKRADGSYSQRGLWDNIRAAAKRNKAAGKAGKKPTAAMLKQEKKIKAKSK
jgi:flagellar basal body rod protein FlgB